MVCDEVREAELLTFRLPFRLVYLTHTTINLFFILWYDPGKEGNKQFQITLSISFNDETRLKTQ